MSGTRVVMSVGVVMCVSKNADYDYVGGYDGVHCFEAPPSPCLLCDATQLLVTVATTMFTL